MGVSREALDWSISRNDNNSAFMYTSIFDLSLFEGDSWFGDLSQVVLFYVERLKRRPV